MLSIGTVNGGVLTGRVIRGSHGGSGGSDWPHELETWRVLSSRVSNSTCESSSRGSPTCLSELPYLTDAPTYLAYPTYPTYPTYPALRLILYSPILRVSVLRWMPSVSAVFVRLPSSLPRTRTMNRFSNSRTASSNRTCLRTICSTGRPRRSAHI